MNDTHCTWLQTRESTGVSLARLVRTSTLLFGLPLALCACADAPNEPASSRSSQTAGPSSMSQPIAAGSAAIGGNSLATPSTTETLLPAAMAGSGSSAPRDAGDEACVDVRAEAKAQLLPSDIVWAIDTSGSMVGFFPAIQAALTNLSTRIVEAGIDAHIVLLAGAGLCVPAPLGSGTCGGGLGLGPGGPGGPAPGAGLPLPALPGLMNAGVAPGRAPDTLEPNFLHLDVPFSSQQGMGVLLNNHPHYKHMLRPNARLQLVLTEDGAPPMTSAAVTDHIEGRASATGAAAWDPPARAGSYVWNGVLCSQGGLGCGMVPTTTLELIDSTDGIVSNLGGAGPVPVAGGQDPFAELLTALAEAVIISSAVSCEYDIPPAPTGETFDRDKVNVTYADAGGQEMSFTRVDAADRCGDRTAWHYDDTTMPSRVTLCPRSCELLQAALEAKVRVGFGCQTLLSPE